MEDCFRTYKTNKIDSNQIINIGHDNADQLLTEQAEKEGQKNFY